MLDQPGRDLTILQELTVEQDKPESQVPLPDQF